MCFVGDNMDNFKSAALSVCMVSAGICAVRSLVSGTVLRNKVETILKIIFAIVLLAPLANGCKDFEMPRPENYELSEYGYSAEKYRDELAGRCRENLTSVLRQQFESYGINCREIEVDVNISEDNSISISKVTVSAEDFAAASEIIRNCLGSETEVENGDN